MYSLIFGVLAMIYSQLYPETLTSIFSNDINVVKVAGEYLKSFSIDCIMVSFVFCMNGYFSGQGKSTISLIHSLIATFGFRIPLTYFISRIDGVTLYELGLAAPISTFVSIIICFGYFYWQNRKEKLSTNENIIAS
ncbi:MATE family efflux transporter [Clostridium celatum]|uniref:MATE family efflux transporter n=1 Tax=Clostridium celatum TaxID=36834 RepID=UPI00311AB973